MVQRRSQQTVRRTRKRFSLADISPRLLKLATVIALLLVVLGGMLGLRSMLNNPENWPISQIDIQGELKYIKDIDLRSIIEKYTQTNLYLLDVDALEVDLETQPWIRAVTLRKAWPDQLIVQVAEQHPVAFWGKERLMNQYGELFAGELPDMQGIFPTLYSPEDKGREMGERFIQMREWLKGLPLEISELTEDERGSWRLKIKEGPEVLIGTEDQERRIERFRVGFLQELAGKLANVRRVDLRYTNGFAVEWKQSPVGSLDITGGPQELMMSKKAEHDVIVALDLGTSKVVALVGEVNDAGRLEIIGIGSYPSRGMKKGVVVNIESTIQSIQRAVEEAELMAGIQIRTVYVGIAGSHVRSLNSHGIVAIKDKEVTNNDVERVMDAARAVAIPADQRILHVLPQEYVIDQQEGIREPVGMSGVRLEARVHLVTAAHSAAQNLVKCVERCGLHVEDIILEQVASSYAVLEEDEKELGVCLVDIGGGTSDIAVFMNGAIHHTAVIPIAGDQVTNDIAVAVRTPTQYAEEIKIKYGRALRQLVEEDELIEVPGVGEREPRSLSVQTLASVIEPRYEELFSLVLQELRRSGYEERIGAGIVLTGGSSKMRGVRELAEEVFHMPVRIGMPRNLGGLRGEVENPIHSTGVGLLLYGMAQQAYGIKRTYSSSAVMSAEEGWWERLKNWFNGNF